MRARSLLRVNPTSARSALSGAARGVATRPMKKMAVIGAGITGSTEIWLIIMNKVLLEHMKKLVHAKSKNVASIQSSLFGQMTHDSGPPGG